ncbi:hypothetical protein [Pseudomonas sp. DC3000-4b1]|uniref:hypothetical protein n=1 Tax=unclassified Pseudomonas TaxID=196821 RepID=UPI003CF29CDA
MEQWYRFPLGHGCAEYQALRDVRRLRLQYDEGTGPQTVFPVMLDRDDISLWLYLPPGNDDLARRLAALPCPCLEQQPDRLVKLSEEYHPAHPLLRHPVPSSGELELPLEDVQFPVCTPPCSGALWGPVGFNRSREG